MTERRAPKLDTTLIDLRDALAHGRVSAAEQNETLRLVKFSKPNGGLTRVTYNQLMTEDWFMEQKSRIRNAITEVHGQLSP